MDTPQMTTHYADGRPSETRDMTPEEIAMLPINQEPPLEGTDETPNAD
jgi:hypothetical protein